MPQEKRTAERVEQEVISGRRKKSMNFVQSISKEDKQLGLKKKKKDFVHLPPIHNNTFVTVTDARGNKKTGASAGCLEEFKGRSRLSRYAAKATAEHVGRSARNLGMKSVVMKVKGSTYFRKKKAVILSWREGYTFAECKRSEGVRDPSKIMYIRDVTQLPHNGCRLPRKRRVQIVPRSSPFSLDNNSGKNLTRREGSTRASALRLLRRASALAFFLKQLADSEEMSFRLCSLMQLDEDRRMGGWKETIGRGLFSYRLGPVMPNKLACGDSGAVAPPCARNFEFCRPVVRSV
uniref:ribosomal protein S11 n=1 Tax=Pulsatilla chinensis TaxID=714493 RepID=UPI002236F3CD|nr:ribosomal protein S11 [Pulsatilla chinensis]YP_010542223.1 ribosomal protein S11 [Pulsatilla cernua]YP_010690197.1 ribosomal protein S11 [Pulsatilla dahurica]UYG19734.1 ribosomal protein S11 [Pulsatilla chinensis var. kissii]UYG19655.1 ribosomal protein S11 [Pulsatilla chinensis]UYG19690.1 ribosomal protein S11 [Pulsatilla cernua]WBU13036.1 ribosomal protein S11 [Pulsatilla dahurica]